MSAKYPDFQYLCFDLPAEYLHYFRHAILLIYLNFSTNCHSPVPRRKHCMELTSLIYPNGQALAETLYYGQDLLGLIAQNQVKTG